MKNDKRIKSMKNEKMKQRRKSGKAKNNSDWKLIVYRFFLFVNYGKWKMTKEWKVGKMKQRRKLGKAKNNSDFKK